MQHGMGPRQVGVAPGTTGRVSGEAVDDVDELVLEGPRTERGSLLHANLRRVARARGKPRVAFFCQEEIVASPRVTRVNAPPPFATVAARAGTRAART